MLFQFESCHLLASPVTLTWALHTLVPYPQKEISLQDSKNINEKRSSMWWPSVTPPLCLRVVT